MRQDGYYWIKYDGLSGYTIFGEGEWQVARYYSESDCWEVPGKEYAVSGKDEHILEVDETPITREVKDTTKY